MGSKLTDAQLIEITKRRELTLELRRAGMSLRDIAAHTGVSQETVRKDINALLTRLNKDQDGKTAQYRQLEVDRLDRMQAAYWNKALGSIPDPDDKSKKTFLPPDLDAAHLVLKVIDRRAKLLGLDMPIKTALTDPSGNEARHPFTLLAVDYRKVMLPLLTDDDELPTGGD